MYFPKLLERSTQGAPVTSPKCARLMYAEAAFFVAPIAPFDRPGPWKATQGNRKGQSVANPRDKWNVELSKLTSRGIVNVNGTMVEIADDE